MPLTGNRADDPYIVTTRDIFQLASQTAGKVDTIIALQTQAEARASATDLDHETRLRALERWRYALPTALVLGAFSAVGTVALYIVERATT